MLMLGLMDELNTWLDLNNGVWMMMMMMMKSMLGYMDE